MGNWLRDGYLERRFPLGATEEEYELSTATVEAIRFVSAIAEPVWSKNSSVLRYQHLNIYYPCHHAFVPCLK